MNHGQLSFSNLKTKISLGLILVMLFGFLPVISNVKNIAVVNSESTCDWTMFVKSKDRWILTVQLAGKICCTGEDLHSVQLFTPLPWGDSTCCQTCWRICASNYTIIDTIDNGISLVLEI
jgi:hypothetical protein